MPCSYHRCCNSKVIRADVRQSADLLVMSSVQIEEAPPALRGAVQHRENTHKCGELTGCRWAPLLYHQVRNISLLSRQLGPGLCPPVAGWEECAAAFKRGAIESHGDDHQQTRHDRHGVSRAVRQQQPPVQLHVQSDATKSIHDVNKMRSNVGTPPFISHVTVHRADGVFKETRAGSSLRIPAREEEAEAQRSHSASSSSNQIQEKTTGPQTVGRVPLVVRNWKSFLMK